MIQERYKKNLKHMFHDFEEERKQHYQFHFQNHLKVNFVFLNEKLYFLL